MNKYRQLFLGLARSDALPITHFLAADALARVGKRYATTSDYSMLMCIAY
jgi:hypothetical protein